MQRPAGSTGGDELVLLTATGRAPVFHRPAHLVPSRLGRGDPGGVPRSGVAACGCAGVTFARRSAEADGFRPCRRCWPAAREGGGGRGA